MTGGAERHDVLFHPKPALGTSDVMRHRGGVWSAAQDAMMEVSGPHGPFHVGGDGSRFGLSVLHFHPSCIAASFSGVKVSMPNSLHSSTIIFMNRDIWAVS